MSIRYRDHNGYEAILGGLTPGGNLETGAVATREGVYAISSSVAAGATGEAAITFSDPMPDADYEIVFNTTSTRLNVNVRNTKTANGFTLYWQNVSDAATGSVDVQWKAFKLYEVSNAEQNASDIANIKAKIPATASSSNKLATSNELSSLGTTIDERLDELEDTIPSSASLQNQLITETAFTAALQGKQDTLTFDTTPTEDSINPVTSDGIKDAIDGTATDIYEVMGKRSAKNLITLPYLKTSATHRGITFVAQNDGTITFSGTPDNALCPLIGTNERIYFPAGTYIVSDGRYHYGGVGLYFFDDEAQTINYSGQYEGLRVAGDGYVYIWTTRTGNSNWTSSDTFGFEKIFTLGSPAYVRVQGRSANNNVGQAISGTIYPMIRLAKDTDSTYQPYALTNQQMTPYVQSVSNPNLLDNPWFTVNQRGQTTYSGASAYCVDRWYRNRNNADVQFDVEVTSNGITVTKLATYGGRIWQKLESINNLVGKTVTMSILYKSTTPITMGLSESAGGSIPFGMSVPASANWTYATRTGIVPSSMTAIYFALAFLNSSDPGTFDIKAVKLELGTASTLANDIAPNYPQELAKCQRYFQRIGQAGSSDTLCMATYRNDYTLRTVLPLTVPMRAAPTVTVNGTVSDYTNSGLTMAKISQPVTNGGAVGISFNISKSGVTWNNGVSKCITPDSTDFYIDFSADL